jgi:hypothetical protein
MASELYRERTITWICDLLVISGRPSMRSWPASRLGIVLTFGWQLENRTPRVDPAFGKYGREVETK